MLLSISPGQQRLALVCLFDRLLILNPDWSGTCYADKIGLESTEIYLPPTPIVLE